MTIHCDTTTNRVQSLDRRRQHATKQRNNNNSSNNNIIIIIVFFISSNKKSTYTKEHIYNIIQLLTNEALDMM